MLRKNFFWNSIGSFIYAATSLFFLIIVTRINGMEDAGIFAFAFANATVFQVIGTYASRTYQVTEQNRKITDNDYVYHRIMAVFLMIFLGIIFTLIRGDSELKLTLMILLLIYKAVDALSETFYGIIQKHDKLYQVGVSFLIRGIIGTAVFLLTDVITRNLIISSCCLVIINLSTLLFYDIPMAKKCGYKFRKIKWLNSLELFYLGFFAFITYLLTQYMINASKYAIDHSLNSDAQAVYGIIAMPATVLILAANFIIAPFLVKIKQYLSGRQYGKINSLVLKMSGTVIVLGIVGSMSGYILGAPLFQLLYSVDITNYIGGLILIIIGATIFAIVVLLSGILIAMRRITSQAVAFTIASISAWFISNYLVSKQGIMGGAWAYLASMFVLLILYIFIYLLTVKKSHR